MELTGIELLIPAIVSGLIVGIRQFTNGLDGPRAYWWSVVLNIIAQVSAALVDGGGAGTTELLGAVGLGAGTGAIVGPGIVASAKRIGLKKVVKPRADK